MDAPAPGHRTSEGAAALLTIGGPLVAAVASLRGWPLVAALGIAAAVACVWIGARSWLKRAGAVALALLVLATPARADEPLPLAARPQAPVATLAQEAAANAVAACPEPCAACGQRVGAVLAPAKPLPTWAQALIGVLAAGGAALTVYQQGHAAGTW